MAEMGKELDKSRTLARTSRAIGKKGQEGAQEQQRQELPTQVPVRPPAREG